MRYVAAYCLAALSGSEPSAKDIEKVLGSVGIDCDAASAKKVVQELKGKNLQEIITEGKGKLGSMPMASGPPGGGGAGGGGSAAAPVDTAAPPPKEEKKEESEEESDEDMGFGLFD